MPPLAGRLAAVPLSATLAASAKARALAQSGVDVISLALGEPDFPAPGHAIEAAARAARDGETKYPPLSGCPGLVAAVQRSFARDHGLEFAPGQIGIANGSKQIIFNAFLATIDPGSQVVIPAPCWVAYPLAAKLLGGVPVFVPGAAERGFRLDVAGLAAAIGPRTRWLVLNFPNNPSGAASSRNELEAVAEVLRRHPHVWVLADDIYEHLLFAGRHVTLAEASPDLADRVLTVSGVSKSYAMTGFRVGYAGGPAPLIAAMNNMQGQSTSGVAGMAQAAAAAALDGPQSFVAERCAVYHKRADFVVAALNAIDGIECHAPEGAFYAFPCVSGLIGRRSPGGKLIGSDRDLADALLEEAHVAVVAGSAFGMAPYLRLSTATDEARLAEALRRIADFARALR